MKDKNILIVAAHPDDEILGCGGLIGKLSKENTVYCLILGVGITSRSSDSSHVEIEALRRMALKSHKVIGIKHSYFENLPDNSFDKLSLLDIIKIVESYIFKIKPSILLTHHHSDLNIDHRLTFQAVMTSCRPQPDFNHPDIYCFEIPSSTDWQVLTGDNMFKPNVFIDISLTIDLKIKALENYITEMKEYPHSRSLKGVKIMAKDWGRKVGKEYVEAFELIRSIRNDI